VVSGGRERRKNSRTKERREARAGKNTVLKPETFQKKCLNGLWEKTSVRSDMTDEGNPSERRGISKEETTLPMVPQIGANYSS